MVGLNQVVLEEYNSFCQYCRLPSQEEYHKECKKLVQQWQTDNFDMEEFWLEYLDEEIEDFIDKQGDFYVAFLPYVRSPHFKFELIDQQVYTNEFLHDKYCRGLTRYSHMGLGCFIEDKTVFYSASWKDFLWKEVVDFRHEHPDFYWGFTPYSIKSINHGSTIVLDEFRTTDFWLHHKYCEPLHCGSPYHDDGFFCFLGD